MSLIAAMVSAVQLQDDRGRRLLAVRTIELVVRNLHGKSSKNDPMFIFYIPTDFAQNFYVQNSTCSHIQFHCIIITHKVTHAVT